MVSVTVLNKKNLIQEFEQKLILKSCAQNSTGNYLSSVKRFLSLCVGLFLKLSSNYLTSTSISIISPKAWTNIVHI